MIVPSYFWTISVFFLLFKDVLSERGKSISTYRKGRIVGGYNIAIQNAPYQAFILLKKGDTHNQCGGSIISNRFILTAAHCLIGVSRVSVRVGSSRSDSGGSTFTSTDFVQHPKFDTNTSDYDIAVIHLPRPIRLDGTNTKPVKLPDSGPCVRAGTELLVSGWGAESENGSTSTDLRAVELHVVPRKKCAVAHDVITSHMFCAGTLSGGKDSCQGDSGGPAVSMGNIQVGIVSFGIGCAREGLPGVYTDVASLRHWIHSTTGI